MKTGETTKFICHEADNRKTDSSLEDSNDQNTNESTLVSLHPLVNGNESAYEKFITLGFRKSVPTGKGPRQLKPIKQATSNIPDFFRSNAPVFSEGCALPTGPTAMRRREKAATNYGNLRNGFQSTEEPSAREWTPRDYQTGRAFTAKKAVRQIDFDDTWSRGTVVQNQPAEQVSNSFKQQNTASTMPSSQSSSDRAVRLLVEHVPVFISASKIKMLFGQFGAVKNVKRQRSLDGTPLRRVLVTMATAEAAEAILSSQAGLRICKSALSVRYYHGH